MFRNVDDPGRDIDIYDYKDLALVKCLQDRFNGHNTNLL